MNATVTTYISKSQAFAIPILNHIRKLVNKACPTVEEKIKWSFPCFEYNGTQICHMASFKQHCSFGFWLESKMKDPNKIFKKGVERTGMGNLGKITSLKDLPKDEIFIKYIHQAMKLIEAGEKLERKVTDKKEIIIPAYFSKELIKNKTAQKIFNAFPYSHKKEYIEWITEAKTETTRLRRMTQAIEWIAQGKGRNWKYER